MEAIQRALGAAITAGSALLLFDILRKQFPREYATAKEWCRVSMRRLEFAQKYAHAPTWFQEAAEVRGLKPGDPSGVL